MVFSTTELFEAVLLQLTLRDLLRVQQVCRRWRDVIVQSPALQQKLFFQPVSGKDYQPELNPLLQALFPPCFQLREVPNRYGFAGAEDIHRQDWFQDDHRRVTVLRPEASWRRMLPVQPPARIGAVVLKGICCAYEEYVTDGAIRSDFEHLQKEGAPMGLIYDILVHFLDDFAQASFFIQWHMFPARPQNEIDRDPLILDMEHSTPDFEGAGSENKITLYNAHDEDLPCNHCVLVPSKLKVIEFDPKIIDYGELAEDWQAG